MIYTVIWLTLLGAALLLPNVLAVRFAVLGVGDAPAAVTVPAAMVKAAARPKVRRPSPQFARRGYLWKAVSPIILGVTVVLGLAVGGVAGYGLMGLGLLNLLWGVWGWDAYVAGKMGKR